MGQRDFSSSDVTKLVLLGTGTPNPSPTQSGCSLALLVNQIPYIIDFGPGLIRKAAALTPRYEGPLEGFHIRDIKTAFLTHLHSDHTTGFPDLILTPWVMGRDEPLKVFGPEGTANMTSHIMEAYKDDIHYRLYGAEPANNQGWRVSCTEFSKEGEIYRDSNIVVEAFPVTHGTWPNSWGFRFTTPDRVIVISGDCLPSEKLAAYARGADLLVHEVYSKAGYETKSNSWKAYHAQHHTSTLELAEIASRAMPGKVILYHILFWGASEEELLREISSSYHGEVIVGRDLDIF
ncbi:MAG: MBL fold metallo-hydrolase [Bacteroidetes bacterium]|nr:MBL fold metallo-hydrolase [Bacteroidota bacterium]